MLLRGVSSSSTSPSLRSRSASARSSSVLPEPEGPRSAMHSPAASSKEVGSRPERERFLTVSMEAADYAIDTRLYRLYRGCASGHLETLRGYTSAASSSKGPPRGGQNGRATRR